MEMSFKARHGGFGLNEWIPHSDTLELTHPPFETSHTNKYSPQ